MPDYMTTGQAAQLLGLRSRSTVRAWFDRGVLAGYQCELTGTIRIERASVEAVIGARTPPASDAPDRRPGR